VIFPEPRAGLVIRYSYLWSREHQAGREEGIKDRPCAIIVSVVDDDGKRWVLVAPITHAPPLVPEDAIEIPAAIKARLGLDTDRAWVVIDEANRFIWPGPDLCPIPGRDASTIVYGTLPPEFFARLRDAFLARFTRKEIKSVLRSE